MTLPGRWFIRPSLPIEHEVIKDTVLSATYAFSGGRRLPFFRDVNMPGGQRVLHQPAQ
jgi:hypothetical protein